MKLAYDELIENLENYYLKEIFNIRMDAEERDNLKIARLDSILESAYRYKLPKVVMMAKNAMDRIEGKV